MPRISAAAAKHQCCHVVPLRAAFNKLPDGCPQCIENTIGLGRWALRKMGHKSFRTKFFIPAEGFGQAVGIEQHAASPGGNGQRSLV